jgi:hypothetical protein
MSKNIKLKLYGYCLTHGYTEVYKNGHCKECVKYQRYWKRRYTMKKYKSLNITEIQ